MHIIVAMSGASGQQYALRLLSRLLEAGVEVSLTLSEAACVTLAEELGIKTTAARPDLKRLLGGAPPPTDQVHLYSPRQISAPIASGSVPHDGMVIVPCSMAMLGRIAAGDAEDLIVRAADVALKERRPLLLVTRETPLSLIHLRNMVTVTEAGAIVLDANPHFYQQPQTVLDVVDTVVDRILQHLKVPVAVRQWKDRGS